MTSPSDSMDSRSGGEKVSGVLESKGAEKMLFLFLVVALGFFHL